MELVGPRAGHDVEDAPGRAAILGAVGVGQDRELLDGLDAAHEPLRARRVAAQGVQDVGAVEHVGVLRGARAVHRDLGPLAGEDVPLVAARLDRPRLEQDELREVPAVQGQALDLGPADELPVGRAPGLHRQPRRARGDLHALRESAGEEYDVGLGILPDAEVHEEARRPEPRGPRRQLVPSDLQLGEGVAPAVIGGRVAGAIRGEMSDGDVTRGITAPELSRTMPVRSAPLLWPKAGAWGIKRNENAMARGLSGGFIRSSSRAIDPPRGNRPGESWESLTDARLASRLARMVLPLRHPVKKRAA